MHCATATNAAATASQASSVAAAWIIHGSSGSSSRRCRSGEHVGREVAVGRMGGGMGTCWAPGRGGGCEGMHACRRRYGGCSSGDRLDARPARSDGVPMEEQGPGLGA